MKKQILLFGALLASTLFTAQITDIPLNKGLLLSAHNEQPITAKTSSIEVVIPAEEGFNLQIDVDIAPLRFESFTEVNFGRGLKATKSRVQGKDLIPTCYSI